MIHKYLPYIILSVFTLTCYGQNSHLKKEINKIISYDTNVDFEDIPGMIISIIDGDSTFVVSMGYRSFDKVDTLVKEDIFEVGSITKLFMSSLILNMVNEGKINFNDKVNNYLPEDYINHKLDSLLIIDLINHNSFFPRLPPFIGKKQKDMQNPYADYTKEDLLLYYSRFDPAGLRRSFSYSHVNYALLEIVAENIFEKEFPEIIQEHLGSKYGMVSSFVNNDGNFDLTPGFNLAGKLVEPWLFKSFTGSEGLKTCLVDLNKFARIMLGHHYAQSIFHPSYNELSSTNFNDDIYIANGWYVVDQEKKYNIYTHTGRTSGYSAFIGLVKETKTAVIILCNSSRGTENLGFLILRMINDNWKRKS